MFQDRINSNTPLFMHEMLYPVAQGIDSDVIAKIYGSCDLEVGGTDQTFNLMMGRKVMEISGTEPQAVLSFELLVGTDGKEKMSKSLDNYIGITDAPNDMFGKIMSLPDSLLASYLELCTFTSMDEVKRIIADLAANKAHPKEVKMGLAKQIVEIYHGKTPAEDAERAFVETFQKGVVPQDIEVIEIDKGTLLVDALLSRNIVSSKSDFRRLVDEGAVRLDGEEKIADPFLSPTEPSTYKIGKHRFVRIVPK
jgi:tyrosyl-tRNA synthetase